MGKTSIGGEGIDALVGLKRPRQDCPVIKATLDQDEPIHLPRHIAHFTKALDDTTRLLIGPSHRAYLRISEGCNRRCSFCRSRHQGPSAASLLGRY